MFWRKAVTLPSVGYIDVDRKHTECEALQCRRLLNELPGMISRL